MTKRTLVLILAAAAACSGDDPSPCDGPNCAPAVCGDGIIDGAEQCDDHNGSAGDGCSECVVDDGWQCSSEPSSCAPLGTWNDGVIPNDLGTPPAGSFAVLATLEIRNDREIARASETANSAIPIAKTDQLFDSATLAIVDDGVWRQAQFDVLGRWGGPPDDTTKPIRWLGVAIQSDVPANTTATYVVRRYETAVSPATDALAVTVAEEGGSYQVGTGVASFTLGAESPALVERIAIDTGLGLDDESAEVYAYDATRAVGPTLELDDGTRLDSSGDNVTIDDFEIVEQGPVRLVVRQTGHFTHPSHPAVRVDCAGDGTQYDRFGFTIVMTFTRGSRDIGLQLNFRNECSDAFSGPWTDEAVTVNEMAWTLPLDGSEVLAAASGQLASYAGNVVVEQRKAGDESTWVARNARLAVDGEIVTDVETLDRPFVAARAGAHVASIQMPWMRYREPQALAYEDGALTARVISDPLSVGEGKGLWNFAKLRLYPSAAIASPADLAVHRDRTDAELERGLLIRRPVEEFNATAVYPSMGNDSTSTVKTHYVELMNQLHEDTVGPGGQWERAQTFGSQLWPDNQFDPWSYATPLANPYENDAAMNYWNPAGAELLEFFRSGDPKFVWDFALPQSYLQMFSAYVNIGDRSHGNRNGFGATSGGSGEGNWHRSGQGSADYSYNQGIDEAYVIRPNVVLRDRFRQAGVTVNDVFTIPQEQQDERWDSNYVEMSRFYMQRFDMLANCAEFTPGAVGSACDAKLHEIMSEIAEDNLKPGIFCQADQPSNSCGTPQQFMTNSMMYGTIMRHYLNYGGDAFEQALVRGPNTLYQLGMAKTDGSTLDVLGDWVTVMDCELTADRTDVVSCTFEEIDGSVSMFDHNRPQTLALLLMSHGLDASNGLCPIVKTALDDEVLYGALHEYADRADGGWWKGSSQMMQSLVFAVGGYDTCE